MTHRLMQWLKPHSLRMLRISLGVIFIWFGILKIIGDSPAEHMVAGTVYWWDADIVVPALGYTEIIIGLGFFFFQLLPWIFPVFLAQILGTFLVLVIRPDIAFQNGNIFLLSQEGEFVMKNLILFTAGLVVFSHHQSKSSPLL